MKILLNFQSYYLNLRWLILLHKILKTMIFLDIVRFWVGKTMFSAIFRFVLNFRDLTFLPFRVNFATNLDEREKQITA